MPENAPAHPFPRLADRLAPPVIVLVLAASACPKPADDDDVPLPVVHECAAAWALPDGAEGVVFADAEDGEDDDGDGSLGAPLRTLGAALDAARGGAGRTVALAAGDYEADPSVRRFELSGSRGDSGLRIAGCGVDETALVGIEAPDPGDTVARLQPVIEVWGDVQGLVLSNFELRGGRRCLIVRDGPGSVEPVLAEGLRVVDCERMGVVAQGLDVGLVLRDVEVEGSVQDSIGNTMGYGVAIQGGGDPWNEISGQVVFEGGRIVRSIEVGLLVDHADIEATSLRVEGTLARDGRLGRGIQIQNESVAILDSVVAEGNSDAAVFLRFPRDVTVRNCSLGGTALAEIEGAEDAGPSGDGLVATQANWGGDPANWSVTLLDSAFSNNGRAGALVEGVTVAVGSGNVFADNGIVGDDETFPLGPDVDGVYLQGGGVLSSGEATELGGESPALEMFRGALELDDLSE
jgi:hypothetical protein